MAKKTKQKQPKKPAPAKAPKPKKEAPKLTEPKKQPSRYASLRLQKRIKHPGKSILGAPTLLLDSVRMARDHWKLFGGILLVYAVLVMMLAGGFSSRINVSDTREELLSVNVDQMTAGVTIFGGLIGSLGAPASQAAGVYQSFLVIMITLAIVWAVRHVMAGEKVGVRDAFYQGMYPIVPFLLILVVIALELFPILFGMIIYTGVFGGGLAMTGAEQFIWAVILFLLALLSLYLMTSTLFALYIATLPDMRPMRALRSARELVRHRRWTIMRKVLFLPAVLLLVAAILTIPVILWAAVVAQWVFIILSLLALLITNIYMYSLYRELL